MRYLSEEFLEDLRKKEMLVQIWHPGGLRCTDNSVVELNAKFGTNTDRCIEISLLDVSKKPVTLKENPDVTICDKDFKWEGTYNELIEKLKTVS